jgi:hypothetical protein
VQAIDCLCADRTRRIEAEGHVRAAEVIIDRLRTPHDLHPEAGEAFRNRHRPVAAGDDHPVETQLSVPVQGLARSILLRPSVALAHGVAKRVVPIRRPQDRPTAGEDAPDVGELERLGETILTEAAESVHESDELVPELTHSVLDRRPYERVQAGTVTTPGHDAELKEASFRALRRCALPSARPCASPVGGGR